MMKLILFNLTLGLALSFFQNTSVHEVRDTYRIAVNQEDAAIALLDNTAAATGEQPVIMAYNGAAHILMAKYVFNPISKLSHFNKGKKTLNDAVAADRENIEIRFLRFSIQSEAPAFLGYKDHLEEDKLVILEQIKDLKDHDLHKMLNNYLLSSKNLSQVEKETLK
jgi:hypothetical protein